MVAKAAARFNNRAANAAPPQTTRVRKSIPLRIIFSVYILHGAATSLNHSPAQK